MTLTPSDILFDGPARAEALLILAHGAGAPMDSPFMDAIARGVGEAGVRVARFEFPYMAARRAGARRPPDREPVLRECWKGVVSALRADAPALFIGGKSMGGRIASMVADELSVSGLVCLGYPFHPPGKPEKTRTAHLETLQTPALFIQGTRDALGSRDDIAGYDLPQSIDLRWLEDGDHSLKPRKSSGRTERQNLDEAIGAIARWITNRQPRKAG
jgi:uncharacterized protein